ncbi:uncharacterized protein F5147DRAFT_652945 [Suillus discolor]|uniref:Uncharacterized protein n=1 Tax=Suillus discolor TaxID=1912936 RepID=A0A9P7F6M5_9AGAM|nr:uncharacterized protein F5147DRAFT_652945 [Suillus discolor]KAG2108223.1 hypothetical protein F5147DRAFT_652945 [Suillus discolor]
MWRTEDSIAKATIRKPSSSTTASGQPSSHPISSHTHKHILSASVQDVPNNNLPKQLACYVPKVHIKPKDVVQSLQVNVTGYRSSMTDEDLRCFADKGGIYELTDTHAWMAIEIMLAQQPGADVIHREIVYDLEGYYYVILTLAIMLDILYTLKRVPNPYMTSGMEMWLYWWLENTIEMEIWYKGFLWWKGCWLMTTEWAKATGGNKVAKCSSTLSALQMNLLYQKEHQDVELNLFCKNARLSQPSHHRPTKSQEEGQQIV